MYNNVQSKIIYNEYTINFKECKVVYVQLCTMNIQLCTKMYSSMQSVELCTTNVVRFGTVA